MRIRPYREEDAPFTLAVFVRAVHATAACDYSPEQLAAWAPPDLDLATWADVEDEQRSVQRSGVSMTNVQMSRPLDA